MRKILLALIAPVLLLTVAVVVLAIASAAPTSLADSKSELLRLAPPGGAPFPDASGQALLQVFDTEGRSGATIPNIAVEIRKLPSAKPFGAAPESTPFYSMYVTTLTSGRVRAFNFNTVSDGGVATAFFVAGGDFATILDEDITIEIWRETDDGQHGPDGAGVLVLTGSIDR